jgi:hypothetical protein
MCSNLQTIPTPALTPTQLPAMRREGGFTLFEFAITVMVISLITGGILSGQALINTARIKNAMADADSFIKGAQTFRDKYDYLPGDLPGAQSFWGSLTGCPLPAYSTVPRKETCNGDGNGHIADHWLAAGRIELFAVWQHLSNAGLIRGTYSGTSTAAGAFDARVGINVPASGFQSGGYMLFYVQPQDFTADANYYDADYGHIVALGANPVNDLTIRPLLTPEDAREIDMKLDDGLPASGRVMAGKSALQPNCTTSDTASAAAYNTGFKGRACALFFLTGL